MEAVRNNTDSRKWRRPSRVIRESQLALKRQKYSLLTRVGLYVVALGFLSSFSLFPDLPDPDRRRSRPTTDLRPPAGLLLHANVARATATCARSAPLSQVPFIINSLIVTVLATAIAVGFGAMAAYGLARFEFKGRKDLAFWILSTRMAPPIAFIVPMFVLIKTVGLLDTWWALVIMYTGMNLSFSVWILRGFFMDIPPELEESALVDGYTRWQVFTRIALPLVKPGLAAVAVFASIFSWNEFLFALILTQQTAKTIPVGIQGFSSSMGLQLGAVHGRGLHRHPADHDLHVHDAEATWSAV